MNLNKGDEIIIQEGFGEPELYETAEAIVVWASKFMGIAITDDGTILSTDNKDQIGVRVQGHREVDFEINPDVQALINSYKVRQHRLLRDDIFDELLS